MSTKKSNYITIRVNPDTKSEFFKIAKDIRKSPSYMIQHFINYIIKNKDIEKYRKSIINGPELKQIIERTTLKSFRLEPKNTDNVIEIPTKAFGEFLKCITKKIEEKNNIKTA